MRLQASVPRKGSTDDQNHPRHHGAGTGGSGSGAARGVLHRRQHFRPSSSSSSSAKKDPAASCKAPSSPGTDALKIGTILPLTGSLAYLNPPAESGVGLAVEDINAAGGVLDKDVTIDPQTDSGDSTDMTVSSSAATKLVNAKVPVAIGAESSSVTLNVIDQLTSSCIVEISPANTATDLSGYSSYYYRTAPPDSVQGFGARPARHR